jgi:serine/threonine-protein kinase
MRGPQKTDLRSQRRRYYPRMPLASGATFAGYTILRLLGSGGMGEVYLAQHPRLPRRDALKILRNDISADDDYRKRFIREADLAAELWHPNIVRVNDRGEFNGQLWISMDFVDGIDGASLLRDRYPAGIPAEEVATIVAAIAGALDYAHQRGLLHRDVKPANILLANPEDGEQRILLSDFGIARNIGDISGLTATNMTIGTVPYAAPEQLTDEPLDGRADQYALAATAYHLLTGSPLFPHSNPAVVIGRHLNTPPPSLANTRAELAALDPVLGVALAKDPADRFARCADFARAFAEAAQPHGQASDAAPTMVAPVASRPPESAAAPPAQANADKPKRRRRSRIRVAAAIAVVVITAAGVIGYMIERNNAPSKPAPPVAVLAGTYRLDYNYANQTVLGSPNPPPTTQPQNETFWVAYRSACTSTGCVATGTVLDKNNHQIAATPSSTSEYHFVEKRWQRVLKDRVQFENCTLDTEGKQVPGSDTEVFTFSLEPQSDGTLRGLKTRTVITSECGRQGAVYQIPFVAIRVGDVAPGVTVADPATVSVIPKVTTPAPAVAGPELNGTYRLELDYPNTTYNNGTQNSPSETRGTEWWAFRSLCTPSGCVATGALLDEANHEEAKGMAKVLQLVDGHWQDVPSTSRIPCGQAHGGGKHPAPTDENTVEGGWTLQLQPDGNLKGVETMKVTTNECGLQGTVSSTPFVATRVADGAPSVILADPALFLAPTAPTTTGPHP